MKIKTERCMVKILNYPTLAAKKMHLEMQWRLGVLLIAYKKHVFCPETACFILDGIKRS